MTTISNLDVEPIAKAIEDLAEDLERRAATLRGHAQSLRETGDMHEVGSALNVAVSTRNMRLDLLVSYAVRRMPGVEIDPAPQKETQPAPDKKAAVKGLKVYSGLSFVRGKQVRTVVATSSQKMAAQLLRVSVSDLRNYWGGGSPTEQEMALAQPGTVFRSTGSQCYNFTAVPPREGDSE